MEFNLSLEVIIIGIALIPLSISCAILFYHTVKYKIRAQIYFTLGWTSFAISTLLEWHSYLLLDFTLFRLQFWPLVLMGFLLFFYLDVLNRNNMNVFNYVLLSSLSTLILYLIYQEGFVYVTMFPDGSLTLTQSIYTRILTSALLIHLIIVYLPSMIRLYRLSPRSLKKSAFYNLLGSILWGPIAILTFGLGVALYVPGITKLIISIGVSFCSIMFVQNPQLAYVLPYKVEKLSIISSKTSAELYQYRWVFERESEKFNSLLFSSLLHGIFKMTNEYINKGNVKEIAVEDAVILVHHLSQYPIIFVLLTSRTTSSLKIAFEHFIRIFESRYLHGGQSNPMSEDLIFNCEEIDKIISEAFPFIPIHDDRNDLKISPPTSDTCINSPNEKQPLVKIMSRKPTETVCIVCNHIYDQDGNRFTAQQYFQQKLKENLRWEVCDHCQNLQSIMILSYFDDFLGPSNLIVAAEGDQISGIDFKEVAMILDVDSDFCIKSVNNISFANQVFEIETAIFRGFSIQMMISFAIPQYLVPMDFAHKFLYQAIDEIRKYKEIDTVIAEIKKKKSDKNKNPEVLATFKGFFWRIYRKIPLFLWEYKMQNIE